MQEVFEKLKSLQVILSTKYTVQDEIRDIPRTLETKIELLNRGKKNYLEKNERHKRTLDELKSLRIRLDDAERIREGYEQQMDLITTQREYEALDKEISDAAEKEQQLRKAILHKEKTLEDLKFQLEEQEELMQLQEEEVSTEQEKMQQILAEKKQELEQLESQEKELVPDIDPEVIFKFERIIKNKSGVGIVPVHRNVCTGWPMSLPPPVFHQVREGNDFKFCPYCSRILFYEEIADSEVMVLETDDEEESDEATFADLVDLDEFDL